MDNHLTSPKSIFSFCLIYVLTFQPTFARVDPLTPPQCGRSKAIAAHDLDVIGGKPAPAGTWPWIGLLAYGSGDLELTCACVLISSKTVVSAGHCIFNLQDRLEFVRFGVYNLSADESHRTADYAIEAIILHPDFDFQPALQNDIAVLILEEEVKFTDFIRPICLPTPADFQSSLDNKFAIIAGWGWTENVGPTSDILLDAQVPIVSTATCARDYESLKHFVIDDRVLCAGYPQGGIDACQGDSGGPMMLRLEDNSYYLIGIVSEGNECAKPDYPGIYTRVTHFLDFVLDNLQ